MKVVDPKTRTTLLINKNYQAFAQCTARAALKHLMTNRASGIDAVGNLVSWAGTDHDLNGSIRSTLSWYGNRVELYEDHPALRSAPNPVTGEDTLWAIPTILRCNHHFGLHTKHNGNTSLKSIYKAYKGVCQYCLEKIPMYLATRDHVVPKDKGGTNDDFNQVLACKDCNNKKDNIFPYFNKLGQEVKPRRVAPHCVLVESIPEIRAEWRPFLYLQSN